MRHRGDEVWNVGDIGKACGRALKIQGDGSKNKNDKGLEPQKGRGGGGSHIQGVRK